MEKKKEVKTATKTSNPRGISYSKDIQFECVKLLKDGLSVDDVSAKFKGHPGGRAIRRFAKRANYVMGET